MLLDLGCALLCVHHCDDNVRASYAKVHSTAHTCNLLAGYDPVSKVSVLSNFHSAEYSSLNMSASYKAEGLCCVEILNSGKYSYILSAGVDDINVKICFVSHSIDAGESVL